MHKISSFSSLLTQGQISEALQLRLEAIETSARYYRQDLEAAKVASAALSVVGLLLSANPLVAVIAGCGLAGYGWTVLLDYQNTKRLCLLPLERKGAGELLTGIGLAATNEQGEADDPLLGVVGYVEPELAHEYELVMVAVGQLTGYLANLPGESRLNAYRHILRHTRLRNSLKLPPLQDVALAIASPVQSHCKAIEPAPVALTKPAIEVKAEVVPADGESVKAQERTVSERVPTVSSILSPEQWTPDLMGYPSILIYGAQGAGKTSTAAWLIRERIKQGHLLKVLDPHRSFGQWDGKECIGDGMDYDAINEELFAFTDEIKARYKTRASVPNYDPPKLTLVCDEFTQWAKKCSHSATFFEESLTDIRKINLHVLFISHARTMTGLGGSSGLAATRDAGLLELELEAQVDPQTKKASPKLLGWLKYPGMPQDQRERVALASWMNGSMDFSGSGVASTVIQQPPLVVEPVAERQVEQEAIASPEPTIELKVSDSLGEPLKTIWLFAKQQSNWVTVRDIQRKDFAILKGKGSEQIHQLLGLVADSGYGEIDEEGKSHSSVRFRAY